MFTFILDRYFLTLAVRTQDIPDGSKDLCLNSFPVMLRCKSTLNQV